MAELDELGWDEYFAGIANAVAAKSKDPNCKVGAVIVNDEKMIVATGFNGLARTLPDDQELLKQKVDKLDWVLHAEHNAILNAARCGVQTRGCTVFVNKFPCFTCMNILVQAGVKRIYTEDTEYWKNDPCDSEHTGKAFILKCAGVEMSAPNHPDFNGQRQARLPELRPGVRKAAPPPAPPEQKAGGTR